MVYKRGAQGAESLPVSKYSVDTSKDCLKFRNSEEDLGEEGLQSVEAEEAQVKHLN